MRISIIGTGSVGSALGKRWSAMNHEITFGSRNPKNTKVLGLLKECKNSKAVENSKISEYSDVIVLATPWSSTLEILKTMGNLAGKTVIDCTNPLTPDLTLINFDNCKSGTEIIAETISDAKIVKAFNTTGASNMMDTMFGIEQATMFICGNDTDAKKTAKLLAIELGFEVVDAGGLTAARNLEALAVLWINLAYQQQMGPNIAFKLLKR